MSPVDLLTWPDLREAELRLEAAEAALADARYRYHHAPRGEREKRQKWLEQTSQTALRAAVELAKLQREAAV